MKGILIVLVVIGHTSITIPYFNPYWFHMPAFFMITGYLTYKWPTFENREQLKKKSAQLLIPYLSYSILFYILLGDIPIWKYALKVIGGGNIEHNYIFLPILVHRYSASGINNIWNFEAN